MEEEIISGIKTRVKKWLPQSKKMLNLQSISITNPSKNADTKRSGNLRPYNQIYE